MQFIIVSGLSGAGKSKAATNLEDLGFYCVDNMPAEMIPQFAQLCLATKGRYEKVALVTDVRGSLSFDVLFQSLDTLDQMGLRSHDGGACQALQGDAAAASAHARRHADAGSARA